MGARLRMVGMTFWVAAVGLFVGTGQAAASDLHLDCSAATPGDGSAASPLNSLPAQFDLGPGDRLLLRRGSTCQGELRLRGGGTASQPASVGAYGTGNAPKVVGTGRDAVRLDDASHLRLEDLDISNPGSGALGEGTEVRNGVMVTAQNEVEDVTLSGLAIHDVGGDLTKNGDGSAAIQATVTGPVPARFDGLRVEGNRITSVSRSGISISGTNDPDRPTADQPWPEASTGVVIEGNRIDLVAGDGIVPRGTDGALVEGNVVSRGNLAGRPLLDPAGPICNAGIWTFRANNTVIRGNEVFGMEQNGCDGTGFDVDYRQDGTVIEGNYSHDNEGGFVLLCTDEAVHRADVRFNLSVDDATMINHGPCGIEDGIGGDLSGIRMFNNTVVGDSPTASIQLAPLDSMYQPGSFEFVNNLVYARQAHDAVPCGDHCSHNAFFNLPVGGTDGLGLDPLLAGPLIAGSGMGAAQGFRPVAGSPLRGAGLAVPGSGATDFFGDPIPAVPAIGFDQRLLADPDPGPDRACRAARAARQRAVKKKARLGRSLKKLRRTRAARPRIKAAARRHRRATRAVRRATRVVRRTCADR
ncbi:MAG: right-handed parallel beta-helix repeat-containing protein [Solirubrobacterales bacterium]|nr:right-handed parallel beta-helix repeat-containing protein [Solirubrobacterales bacterium]